MNFISNRWLKLATIFLLALAYQELTIRYGFCEDPPLPPPPSAPATPLGGPLLQVATVGAVLGYGAYRMWKK